MVFYCINSSFFKAIYSSQEQLIGWYYTSSQRGRMTIKPVTLQSMLNKGDAFFHTTSNRLDMTLPFLDSLNRLLQKKNRRRSKLQQAIYGTARYRAGFVILFRRGSREVVNTLVRDHIPMPCISMVQH